MRKIQIKLWQNPNSDKLKLSNYDKTKKTNWENSNTWIEANMKKISNYDNFQKLKLGTNLKNLKRNSKYEIMTKFKNSNCEKSNYEKTQILTILNFNTLNSLLVRTTGHLDTQWDVLWAAVCDLAMFWGERN